MLLPVSSLLLREARSEIGNGLSFLQSYFPSHEICDCATVKTYTSFYLRTSGLLTIGAYDSVSGRRLAAAATGPEFMSSEV